MKTKKIRSITIIGKRWFDRVNGNTYCSSRVLINGEEVLRIPWTYGYGSFYEQKAKEVLREKGIIKLARYENGMTESFFDYCNRNKIAFESYASDGLKRDMVAWGKE